MALGIAADRDTIESLSAFAVLSDATQEKVRQAVAAGVASPVGCLDVALSIGAELLVLAVVLEEGAELQDVIAVDPRQIVRECNNRVRVMPWVIGSIFTEARAATADCQARQERVGVIRREEVRQLEVRRAVDPGGIRAGLVVKINPVFRVAHNELVHQSRREIACDVQHRTLAGAVEGRLDGIVVGPRPERGNGQRVPGVVREANEDVRLVSDVLINAHLVLTPVGGAGCRKRPSYRAAVGLRNKGVKEVRGVHNLLRVHAWNLVDIVIGHSVNCRQDAAGRNHLVVIAAVRIALAEISLSLQKRRHTAG